MTTQKPPKIFISYCWTNEEHKKRVEELASSLRRDQGVEVTLDIWHLKPGHDKYKFMEKMVADPKVAKVLMICDKKYKQKADQRTGGVGDETSIITPEVYNDTDQTKFIPVIFEKDEHGQPYLPAYLKSRMYIDLSTDEYYDSEYERLVRLIWDKPEKEAPPVGEMPKYLKEENKTSNSKLPGLVRQLKYHLREKPHLIDSTVQDFLDQFLGELRQHNIPVPTETDSNRDWVKEILQNVVDAKPFIDDFIDFIILAAKYKEDIDLTGKLLSFYEEITDNFDGRQRCDAKNMQLIIYGLFVLTIGILNEHDRYDISGRLLHEYYFLKSDLKKGYKEPNRSSAFCIRWDEDFSRYYQENFYRNRAPYGHIILNSITPSKYIDHVINTDFLIFQIAQLKQMWWYPHIYLSSGQDYRKFQGLRLKRNYAKMEPLFGVTNFNQLQVMLKEYSDSFDDKKKNSLGYLDLVPPHVVLEGINTL